MQKSLFDERAAASYEDWYSSRKGRRFDRAEKRLLAEALDGLTQGKLLEVGCGTGHFSRFFAQRGWQVTGIDLSPAMLKQAQRYAGAPVYYTVADAVRLPFADSSFEVVAFIATVEFIEDLPAALVEAFRVARRALVIGFLNKWSFIALRRRLRSLFRREMFSVVTFYTGNRLADMIRKAVHTVGKELQLSASSSGLMLGRFNSLGAFGVICAKIEKRE